MKILSLQKAAAMIPNGARLLIGGFMGVGTPERLVDEIVSQGKRNLTVIANDATKPGPKSVNWSPQSSSAKQS